MQEDNYIFEKLNSHRLPVDESYWTEMEGRLLSDRKKVVPLWAWLAGAGVAASLALLFTLSIFNVDNDFVGTQITQIERISTDNVRFADGVTLSHPVSNDTIPHSATLVRNAPATYDVEGGAEEAAEPLLMSSQFGTETPVIPTEGSLQSIINSPRAYSSDDFKSSDECDEQFQKSKHKKKKSWQIAAAFGSGFSNSSHNDMTFLNDNSAYYPAKSPSSELLRSQDGTPSIDDIYHDFPELTHLPPLSVGVTVRRNLSEYMALETGLTYSFLQSGFKDDNQWYYREAKLKLHYIGIPVNVVTYLLNKPQWNVYFSFGIMAEKGIMLDYVQNSTSSYTIHHGGSSPVHTISLQDNIPGLQWSFNTSFGVGYKFYRDISLYFEPRILYYLKNNQPVSARTEMPLLVGLNAGLRFEFEASTNKQINE